MTPSDKERLLLCWARSEMSLIDISEKWDIPYKKVRFALGIPPQGTADLYELKLKLLSPSSLLLAVRREGGKTYLKVESEGQVSEREAAEMFSRLRYCPPKGNLVGLLADKSNKDKGLITRWAKGEALSSIARKEHLSRGRLRGRLGLPPARSKEAAHIRLEALAPHLTLLDIGKSKKSSDLVLSLFDVRRNVEFSHPYSWVLKMLRDDPNYMFFPSAEETFKSRVQRGTSRTIRGVSAAEYAKTIGSSYATVQKALHGKTSEEAIQVLETYKPGESALETQVAAWLSNLVYKNVRNKKLEGTPYFPDFVVTEKRIIVECDGLYWHSDAVIKDTKYHKKKREAYLAQGYRPFFFRENEINNKPKVCMSVLANALGSNARVFARKTQVVKGDANLIESSHLMGKGRGRVYSLKYEGEVVASMQVKFLSLKNKTLDISRFCSAPGVSVVGGFSKLIAHAEKVEKPRKIQTFIDLRYGSGEYLAKLGWVFVGDHLSFCWTDARGSSYHRMKFPGNSGYEEGMHKVWDCGQAKWELPL